MQCNTHTTPIQRNAITIQSTTSSFGCRAHFWHRIMQKKTTTAKIQFFSQITCHAMTRHAIFRCVHFRYTINIYTNVYVWYTIISCQMWHRRIQFFTLANCHALLPFVLWQKSEKLKSYRHQKLIASPCIQRTTPFKEVGAHNKWQWRRTYTFRHIK